MKDSKEFLSGLASRMGLNDDQQKALTESVTTGGELPQELGETLKEKLGQFSTAEYFLNNSELLGPIKEKSVLTGKSEAYDGITARRRAQVNETYGELLSPEELSKIWDSKGAKLADRFVATDKLVKKKLADLNQEVQAANKKLLESSPEEYQKALKENQKVIEALNDKIKAVEVDYTKQLADKDRGYELTRVETRIAQKIAALNLSNPNLAGIATEHITAKIKEGFYPKIKDGKVVLMNKENPELAAIDTESSTLVEIDKVIATLSVPFVSRNGHRGGYSIRGLRTLRERSGLHDYRGGKLGRYGPP